LITVALGALLFEVFLHVGSAGGGTGGQHAGHEEVYVLNGDLQTEGCRMGPGDFLHSDPGTLHHALYSEHGCRALLVVPLPKTQGK